MRQQKDFVLQLTTDTRIHHLFIINVKYRQREQSRYSGKRKQVGLCFFFLKA